MHLIRKVENFNVRRDLYAAVQMLLKKETTTQRIPGQFFRRQTQKPPATSSTAERAPDTTQWTASSMLTRPDSTWMHSRPPTNTYGGLRRPTSYNMPSN